MRPSRLKTDHLAMSMNSGISAPRTVDAHILSSDALQGPLKFALDRGLIYLYLEPSVFRAVIFDNSAIVERCHLFPTLQGR